TRAHQYEKRWADRAQLLEELEGIPCEYRVWDKNPPEGIPAKYGEYFLIYFFGGLWILFAGYLSGLCIGLVLLVLLVGSTIMLGKQLVYIFRKESKAAQISTGHPPVE